MLGRSRAHRVSKILVLLPLTTRRQRMAILQCTALLQAPHHWQWVGNQSHYTNSWPASPCAMCCCGNKRCTGLGVEWLRGVERELHEGVAQGLIPLAQETAHYIHQPFCDWVNHVAVSHWHWHFALAKNVAVFFGSVMKASCSLSIYGGTSHRPCRDKSPSYRPSPHNKTSPMCEKSIEHSSVLCLSLKASYST